jgi:hypothetical protein
VLQPTLSDDDAVRDTDEFHVGEHDARALVPIVQQDFDAGVLQRIVQASCGIRDLRALAKADGNDGELLG